MAKLNEDAKNTLRAAGVSQAQWRRMHYGAEATVWYGDACGCPDDRCIGYHHDATDECQCLPALLRDSMSELVDADGAGALCRTPTNSDGVPGHVYRSYVSRRGAPDAVSRDLETGRKLYDAAAVRAWNAGRPGRGARIDLKEKGTQS